jgi:excisionase family DNA binding protein
MSIPNFPETERIVDPMESNHELLTVKEVCDLLRVHYSTVYKLARDGRIPGFRVGTDWRFRRDMIERGIAGDTPEPSVEGDAAREFTLTQRRPSKFPCR